MDDVTAGEGSARLVSHGVNDTQQSVGERHTGQALCVVHTIASFHVAIIGLLQVGMNHLDSMQGQRIGIVAVERGNIRFNRMGHSVHTGVSRQFRRHGFSQSRVNDGHVRGDVEDVYKRQL